MWYYFKYLTISNILVFLWSLSCPADLPLPVRHSRWVVFFSSSIQRTALFNYIISDICSTDRPTPTGPHRPAHTDRPTPTGLHRSTILPFLMADDDVIPARNLFRRLWLDRFKLASNFKETWRGLCFSQFRLTSSAHFIRLQKATICAALKYIWHVRPFDSNESPWNMPSVLLKRCWDELSCLPVYAAFLSLNWQSRDTINELVYRKVRSGVCVCVCVWGGGRYC